MTITYSAVDSTTHERRLSASTSSTESSDDLTHNQFDKPSMAGYSFYGTVD
jgi:hypothetical protein